MTTFSSWTTRWTVAVLAVVAALVAALMVELRETYHLSTAPPTSSGREHRDVVIKALRAAGCQSIRVIDLPNLPPKGDVVDWAAAGGPW